MLKEQKYRANTNVSGIVLAVLQHLLANKMQSYNEVLMKRGVVLGLIAFLCCTQVDVKKATPKEKMAAAANRGRGAGNGGGGGRGRGRGRYLLFTVLR